MQIKIFNLSPDINDRALERMFTTFGTVNAAVVDRNVLNGRSKGNGLVDMPLEKEARQAITSLDQTVVGGKRISVREWPAS